MQYSSESAEEEWQYFCCLLLHDVSCGSSLRDRDHQTDLCLLKKSSANLSYVKCFPNKRAMLSLACDRVSGCFLCEKARKIFLFLNYHKVSVWWSQLLCQELSLRSCCFQYSSPLILCSSPLAGGSTPPGITAPAVPSIPSPIGVNGFTGLPPQANGQPAAEAVFANGIHPYPGKPDHCHAHSLLHPYQGNVCSISYFRRIIPCTRQCVLVSKTVAAFKP